MNLPDGNTHEFALSTIDWDGQGRVETIQIVNANSGTQLDSRSISSISCGTYLVWNIVGHVHINATVTAGPNAVISGVFFDPSSSGGGGGGTPSLSITKTHSGNFTQVT